MLNLQVANCLDSPLQDKHDKRRTHDRGSESVQGSIQIGSHSDASGMGRSVQETAW